MDSACCVKCLCSNLLIYDDVKKDGGDNLFIGNNWFISLLKARQAVVRQGFVRSFCVESQGKNSKDKLVLSEKITCKMFFFLTTFVLNDQKDKYINDHFKSRKFTMKKS